MVGSSRLLRGYGITSPLGDFTMSEEDEEKLRKEYINKALEMLQHPGAKENVATV